MREIVEIGTLNWVPILYVGHKNCRHQCLRWRLQQSTGLERRLLRIFSPFEIVEAVIERPHCTTDFVGGE